MRASNTNIVVRAATRGDRCALIEMLSDFIEYLNAIEPGQGDPANVGYLVDLSIGDDPVCSALIADRDGTPAGYVAFHPGVWEIYKAIYVVSLFVVPQARRCGVARALMEKVREVGRDHGAERVVLFVWKKNALAVDFYRSLGAAIFDDNHLMAWQVT